MNARLIGFGTALAAISAANAYAIYWYGVVGLFQLGLANAATVSVAIDLTIALGLVLSWLIVDARERGVSALPFVVLTLGLGSIGPLLYLIGRELRSARPVQLTAHARS